MTTSVMSLTELTPMTNSTQGEVNSVTGTRFDAGSFAFANDSMNSTHTDIYFQKLLDCVDTFPDMDMTPLPLNEGTFTCR